MQQTELETAPPAPPPRRGLSPMAAIAVIAALLAFVSVGLFLVAKPDVQDSAGYSEVQAPTAEGSSRASAIKAFTELSARASQLFDTQDVSVASSIYTDKSPVLENVISSIRELRERNVRDKGRFERMRLAVISVTPERAVIREVTLYYPCFLHAGGRDVTQGPGVIEQTNLYTLRHENGVWQIHDAVLEKDRVHKHVVNRCTTSP